MQESQTWRLGETSAKYETRGLGAGTISVGRGDFGGPSYGEFQLSSTRGTLQAYLDQSRYRTDFLGLSPATPGFDQKWRELALQDGFRQDQYDFVKRTHYDVQLKALKSHGLDLTDRGPAVQDAIWSTAVQTGNKTLPIFQGGLTEKFGRGFVLESLTDKDIVEAVQDYKYNHTEDLFRHSFKQWHGLRARALQEKADLVHLAEASIAVNGIASVRGPSPSSHGHARLLLGAGAQGADVYDLQFKLGQLGYRGARGEVLRADTYFGPSTKAAVEAFQAQHKLAPDGVAGPATLDALAEQVRLHANTEASMSQRNQNPASLDHPAHPDHAFYRRTHALVCELDRQHGRTPDPLSSNLASALVVSARQAGMARIDRLALDDHGAVVWGMQSLPGTPLAEKCCRVDALQALNTPAEHSAARWPGAMQAYGQQQEILARAQVPAPSAHAVMAAHER